MNCYACNSYGMKVKMQKGDIFSGSFQTMCHLPFLFIHQRNAIAFNLLIYNAQSKFIHVYVTKNEYICPKISTSLIYIVNLISKVGDLSRG